MLDMMRKHSQSFLIYVLFAAIIAVFVISFGPGGQSCSTQISYAAEVNGERISEEEFRRTLGDQIRQFQQMNPKAWDPKLVKQLDLKRQIMDQLIEGRLLRQAAAGAGLTVTKEELSEFLLKAPAFQVNGQFDFTAYERYVNYAVGTSTARFEADLMDKLLAQKYRQAVESAATVSDAELLSEFLDDNDKVDLDVAIFKESDVAKLPEPTAAEVEAFQKEHAAEIEARYNRDLLRYREPRKLKARHILIKVAENAGPAEVEKAKARIEEIEKQVAGGADFSEVAKQKSEDSSKDRGGDLGWFGPGTMVKAFEDAANALKPGEVSKPVRSPFGFHLIKLDEVKEGHSTELAAVSADIAKALIAESKRRELAHKQAEAFLAELKSGKSIKDLAVPEPESDSHALGETPPKAPPGKVLYKVTGPFNRGASAIPKIGIVEGLLADAFTLDEHKRVLDKVYSSGDRSFVVELKARDKVDEKKFDTERSQLRTAALTRKKSDLFRAYVKQKRESSDIRINDKLLAYDES